MAHYPGPNPQSTFLGGTIMSYSEIIINGCPVKLIPLGDCACGCGQKTSVSHRNAKCWGWIKGQPKRFIHGHNERGKKHFVPNAELNRNWKGGRTKTGKYPATYAPDHPRGAANGYVHDHVLLAEKALGKALPLKAVVHHHTPEQLVICQNQAYHLLLHRRQRALETSKKGFQMVSFEVEQKVGRLF